MTRPLLLALTLSLLFSFPALASGSSGAPSAAGVPTDPLTVTETLKCVVTAIREDGTVIVRDQPGAPEHPLLLTAKTKVRAQDKMAFGGRKKLELADLEVGQQLRVTHRPATGETVKIKVLKHS